MCGLLNSMRKFYNLNRILNEGGNAIKQSMPIPAEIAPSLADKIAKGISDELGVQTAVYGSVGKKKPGQTHGDLDIGVQMSYNEENLSNLKNAIYELFGQNVVETKDMPGLKLFSFGYCYVYKSETKVAQVDCMFTSSVEIGSFSYYSPNLANGESKFKGLFRTELLDSIIGIHPIDTNKYPEDFWEDEFDGKFRGQVKRYWKYSFDRELGVVVKHKTYESPAAKPKGPLKNSRTIKEDTILFLNKPEKIVKWALGPDATMDDANSFESLVDYIVKHWDSNKVDEVLDIFFNKNQFKTIIDGSVERAKEYIDMARGK